MSSPHGILLADKAPAWTSHDVVGRARRLLGTKKVGHAGTLDPMATGLLILGVGQGTRLLTYLVGLPKTYRATIRLGSATSTDDAEGEPLGDIVDASGIAPAAIEHALGALRGQIAQVPSAVSAIKVDGRRAYARVRAGEEVQLAARPVRIDRFDLLADRTDGPFRDLDVHVDCSSGTYIRALARDLGSALGTGGHLTALRRTHVGPFAVADAVALPPRGQDADVPPLRGLGQVARAVLADVVVDAATAADLGHGRRPRIQDPAAAAGTVAVLDPAGHLVAVAELTDTDQLRPLLVVPLDART